MNKYTTFGLIILWLLFATFLVNAVTAYTGDDSFGVDNPIGNIDSSGDTRIGSIKSLANTFSDAITFNIDGLPVIFAVIFFTAPSFVLAYMSIEILMKTLELIIAAVAAAVPF